MYQDSLRQRKHYNDKSCTVTELLHQNLLSSPSSSRTRSALSMLQPRTNDLMKFSYPSKTSNHILFAKRRTSVSDSTIKKVEPIESAFIPTKPYLLPPPPPSSIGNFFDYTTDATSFIQCYMLGIGSVNNDQYGIGYPMDMPVMLTYFEDNELKPVKSDYEHYDHLVNHVSVQLDYNDMQLYKTPIVLTLQGDFDDKDINKFYPNIRGVNDDDVFADEEADEDVDEVEEKELTLEQLLSMEEEYEDDDDFADDGDEEDIIDTDAEDYDDDDDGDEDDDIDEDEEFDEDDENGDISSFWEESPVGDLDGKFKAMPDYAVVKGDSSNLGKLSV